MNINTISTLTPEMIAKAWRSPEFAATLPTELQAQLPASPAGEAAGLLAPQSESHHNTIACNTTQCHTSHCVSTICATTRATLCH